MTPEGWRTARLQDLAENPSGDFVDGDWIESKDQDENGTIRLLQVGNVLRGKLKTEGSTRWVNEDTARRLKCTLLREGDILIARMPDPIGRACLLPSLPYLSITAVDCAVLRVDRARVSPSFAVQYFNSDEHLAGVASHITGTTRQRISRSNLARLPIPLPPVGEQCKIAAILSSMDEAIEATQAVIDQFQVVKKAMMAELLTRGLPGRHTRFKQTEIGEVPEDWDVVRLDSLAVVQTGVAKGKKVENGIELPYLRVANVQDGFVDLTEVKLLLVEASSVNRFRLRSGDVLFTEGGDADKLGRGCVWRGQIDRCLHQNHVFAVRPDTERLRSEFLALWAASPRGKAYFFDCAKRTTNLASINSSQLKALPVPLPTIEVQDEIIRAVSLTSSRLDAESACLEQLRLTKSALMSVLLTGEVRVTPDKAAA